jgi:hypothetical protein
MRKSHLLVVFGLLLAFSFVVFGSPALAATPDFTIAATNVSMSSSAQSGTGTSSFTLTSVNGYAGTVHVDDCEPPTPPVGVKLPGCGTVPAQPPLTLTANQVLIGTIHFYNSSPCDPCPVSLPRRGGHGLAPGLALAGALLFGFGIRRRAPRWLTLILLAAGTLVGLGGISACGGNNNAATPGTYVYTIAATDVNTAVQVNATFNVTVP